MTTQNNIEEEVTIFAKIGDFNGFNKADDSANIQELNTFLPGKGKYRHRKISDGNGTFYVVNIKGLGEGGVVKAALDEDLPSTAAFYEAGRAMADRLVIRDRFLFNGSPAALTIDDKEVLLPPIDYQVDVFHRFDGRESEWAKIDIEVNRLLDAIRSMGKDPDNVELTIKVSHLPFLPQDAFIVSNDNTPEEKALIKKIWEEYSQSPNGGPLQPMESSVKPGDQNNQQTKPVSQPSDNNQSSEGQNGGENNV